MDADLTAEAELLIAEVNEALARGTKHYHPETGALLDNMRAIIDCLADHRAVVFVPASEGSD